MAKLWNVLNLSGGILVMATYIIGLLLARANYSGPYSPFTNWLSDLGSPMQNPNGHFFYNAGCIITAICFFIFVISLRVWKTGERKKDVQLVVGQFLSCPPGFAIVMAAIFNIDSGETHSLWSAILVITFGYFFVMIGIALFTHAYFIKAIAIYGFIISGVSMIYGFGINTPLLEWIVISLYIVFIFLLSLNAVIRLNSYYSSGQS